MNNIGVVVYGCTEIDLLMRSKNLCAEFATVDSNQALADFCIAFANNEIGDDRIRLTA